jgi:hypothetical protein
MMTMRALGTGIALTVGLVLIAPHSGAAQVDTNPARTAQDVIEDNDGKVTITNHNWSDMRIYMVRQGLAGSRVKLGTVMSQTSRNLKIPDELLRETDALQLVAIPIGGTQGVVSSAFPADWSDGVEWVLQQALYLSGRTFRSTS